MLGGFKNGMLGGFKNGMLGGFKNGMFVVYVLLVSMHGSLILSFRPSETINYPFTCYEHVIAKAMGVMPMVWVDYWLPADSGDPGHLTNPTPSGATTTLLLRIQAGLGQT